MQQHSVARERPSGMFRKRTRSALSRRNPRRMRRQMGEIQMSEDLFKLAQAHQIEPLKQAISETKGFDINEFFNDNFMFWSVEDIEFLGKHFDISVNIRDNAALIKPSVLDYFLNVGLKLEAETVEELLTLGDEEKLNVLMAHDVSIPAESIFMWPIFNRENLLKAYLDNGGDPNVCDEDGTSLIDAWYSQSGECPAVAMLETHGAVRSADALTMKEKLAFIADFGRKMKDDPEFAKKVEQAAAQMAKAQEEKRAPEEMTDAEIEAHVNKTADDIEALCDEMEKRGLEDDIAIAEAGMEQAARDVEKACADFDKEMSELEKEWKETKEK